MTTGDCEAPVVDDSMAKIREQSFDINVSGHRSAQRDQKIRNLANKGSTAGERAAAAGKLKGPTLPLANSYELEGNQLDENPLAVGAALGVAAGGAYLVKKAAEAGKAMRKNAEKRMGIKEAQDHEVAMAQSQLDSAAKNINTLKKSLGKKEKNIPAWMQAKITDTAHNMDAAATYKESAAWTKKSGKNKEGGLNEKGRKSYERENPGSDLKAPSKEVGNPRRKSFCARMSGMKKKLTSSKTANDPDSRINKSLRAWNC